MSTAAQKTGMPPGSLVHVGEHGETVTTISILDYNGGHFEEKTNQTIGDILHYRDSDSLTWVIVEGLSNVGIVESIGAEFGIHQLVLEDILNTHQRPRFEEFDNHLFIVLKCLLSGEPGFRIEREQVSLLVMENLVFTFKEKNDDLFEPLRQRIRTSKGRVRELGSDYLTYAILDTIVDHNFVLMDQVDAEINDLEDTLLEDEPDKAVLNRLQQLRREIIGIRSHVSPVRELMAAMIRSESPLIDEYTRIYLRDVSDHVIRVIESMESYREILTGLLEIYMSSVSNRMNEVMKVLTVFASIFIPLSFIAGIYGMNFEYMPELKARWAYPALWVTFIAIPAVLLVYFRRKGWL